jgi:exoribonuclease II
MLLQYSRLVENIAREGIARTRRQINLNEKDYLFRGRRKFHSFMSFSSGESLFMHGQAGADGEMLLLSRK